MSAWRFKENIAFEEIKSFTAYLVCNIVEALGGGTTSPVEAGFDTGDDSDVWTTKPCLLPLATAVPLAVFLPFDFLALPPRPVEVPLP